MTRPEARVPLGPVTLAIDHVKAMRACLAGEASAEDLGALKCRLAATGGVPVLTDPAHCLSDVRAELGPNHQLVVSIEDGDYAEPGRSPRLLPHWNVEQVVAAGADVVKCFFWYRPGREGHVARQFLAQVADDCASAGVGLLAEPVLTAVPGETPTDHAELLVETVRELTEHRLSALKLEFPGGSELPHDLSAAACARITAAATVPWYLLSQGVPFDVFELQLAVAVAQGAVGCVVGRAVWGDLVSTGVVGDQDRTLLRHRLGRLDAIVSANWATSDIPTHQEDR